MLVVFSFSLTGSILMADLVRLDLEMTEIINMLVNYFAAKKAKYMFSSHLSLLYFP